jgi:anti-sigma regulatory factor (Ser/Thr protein kinase)
MRAATERAVGRTGFRHEVRLYAGEGAFVDATAGFVRDGVRAGNAVLVAVDVAKISRLRVALGSDAGRVQFADMREIGRNPGTLIPAWRAFVDRHAADGRAVRGVGEPMWRERSPAAKAECHHHEALLNLAFRDDPDLFLLCPYDTHALEAAIVERALARHPYAHRRPRRSGARYAADGGIEAALAEPLPRPGADARTVAFASGDLADVRAFVRRRAAAYGMAADRTDDLVLATHEAAANSVRHGGGQGLLRMWLQDGHVVCEVADRGWITDPLVGRRHPAPGPGHSRGMWLIHHVCDLVQVRSTTEGTVVRLHVGVPG